MTVKAINERLEIETIVHETAKQIVEMVAAAKAKIAKLGGDEEECATRMIELVSEDE